jgi:hypothetical protein
MATPIGIKNFTIFFNFINVLSFLCVFLCFKLFHPSYVSCCLYTSNSSCKLHYMFQVFFSLLALSKVSFVYYYFGSCFYIFFCLLLFWVLLDKTMKQKSLLPFAMLMLFPLLCCRYFCHCIILIFTIVLLFLLCY